MEKVIDLDKVVEADKLEANGRVYTKYDTREDLLALKEYLHTGIEWVGKEDYSKMWKWIGSKETRGEHCFGKPPMKEVDRDAYPQLSHTGIDVSQVIEKDRIEVGDQVFTKHDSLLDLHDANVRSKQDEALALSKEEQTKLWGWIGAKERFGEDCYGPGPKFDLRSFLDKGDKVIDLDALDKADKLETSERTYTKYDTREDLLELKGHLHSGGEWIGKEDYSKMWKWINAKESRGEHCFGKPPVKDKEIEIEGPQLEDQDKQLGPMLEPQWNRLTDMEPLLKGLDEFLGVQEPKFTDKELLFQGLNDFLSSEGSSQAKEHEQFEPPTIELPPETRFDDFIGFSPNSGPEIEHQHEMGDLGILETPRESDDIDRDDSSDLFEMGIN